MGSFTCPSCEKPLTFEHPEEPTTGNGAFLGMIAGGAIGLVGGPVGVVIGGILGAVFGDQVEREGREKQQK
jgi:outer membrane lipoprotein SlyB